MLSDIQRPVSASVVKSIWRSVLAGNAGPVDPVFPEKDFYFADFTGIADGTILRTLPGWAAYSSTSSTHPVRDQWVVQNEKATRTFIEGDYTDWPGRFIIGRDTGSTDHVYRCKLVDFPETIITLAVAATDEANCIYLYYVKGGGNFVIEKKTAGSTGGIFGKPASSSALGRLLEAGDEIELRVLGRRIHLLVNGLNITPPEGANIDNGGTFTKGTVCGHGTFVGEGSAFTDEYFAPLSAVLTVADSQIFWPGDLTLMGRNVLLNGSYSGDVQAIDYRVVNAATGAETKPWARVSAPTIDPSNWSASVFVPMCDTAVNPKVRVELRAANDTDSVTESNNIAVGICVGSYGQSNSSFRGQGSATPHVVSNAYTFADDAGSEWQGGATTTVSRSQLWATQISAASGIPCGVFGAGSGSKTIIELSTRGGGNFVLDEMEALCTQANAFGYVASWLWTQGEAEASAAATFDASAYSAQFDVLMSELRSGASSIQPTATFGICAIGSTTSGHQSGTTFGDANWSASRACSFALADKPGVFLSSSLADATLADNLHPTADAYVENGRRAGLSMRKALGYGGYDGRGPLVTGATRSGAVVTLAIDLNGAASISGTGLTHYQVSADNFATLLTVSSAAVSGGNIALTLSTDPGTTVKVRSFYGMDWTAPVRAIGTYADGTTIPVEPIFSAITSNQ